MYIYIQTIFVYLFIAFAMAFTSKNYIKTGKYEYILVAIFVYAFIFGLRYGVGVDYFAYVEAYKMIAEKGIELNEGWEPGYVFLMRVLAPFHSSSLFLGVVAFMQLYLITRPLKTERYIYPVLFAVFMLHGDWMSHANTMRQCIALGFWTLAIKYAIEKNLLRHYLFILLAISFHRSAMILLPFYPLLRYKTDWFKNVYIELAMLVGALFVMKINVVQEVLSQFDRAIMLLGYDAYMSYNEDLLDAETTLGIGFYITLITHVIIIANSEKMKAFYNKPYINVLYSLYFVGTLANYIFITSQLLNRLNMYFKSFFFIIIAFTIYYAFKSKHKVLLWSLGGLVVLAFIAIMYRAGTNWNLFVFNWQEQYFYLHSGHNKY